MFLPLNQDRQGQRICQEELQRFLSRGVLQATVQKIARLISATSPSIPKYQVIQGVHPIGP